MNKEIKISVITPSYNNSDTIERAINSVLSQGYADYEHIIVDGASTDHTPDILSQYSHLKWVSEPDNGQVEAMNKGFRMAIGDVIVYLNADDYFLKGAFFSVMPHFLMGEDMVMGKVLVRSQEADGIREWINDPKTDVESMLYHWEANAFCVNPVGYFYRRAIQEEISYSEENVDKHDLEFLIEVAMRYEIKKIDALLGAFNLSSTTKTAQAQSSPGYWRNENFPFIDRAVQKKSYQFQKKFHLDRERGYQLRRRWAVRDKINAGFENELMDQGQLFFLPEDGDNRFREKGTFGRYGRYATKGDWVIPVLTMGHIGGKAIYATLKSLSKDVLPAEVYHIHGINENRFFHWLPKSFHLSVGSSLKKLINEHKSDLCWKFIIGMAEPIGRCLSGIYENGKRGLNANSITKKILKKAYPNMSIWFDEQIGHGLGIDLYNYKFDKKKGYSIIKKGNIDILLYRMENLSEIFSQAMEEFLGIPDLTLSEENLAPIRALKYACRDLEKHIRLNKAFLHEVYSTNLLNYFYTDKEISEFYERWTDG